MIKKISISIILIILASIGIVTASIKFIDRQKIYQTFMQDTHMDISSIETGDFTIKLLPSPYLVIDQIDQKNKITVKNVKIYFSILSLLTFNPKITNFDIEEATVHLNHNDIKFLNHDELISELISKDQLFTGANIDKLIFLESDKDIPLIIENFSFKSGDDKTAFIGMIDNIGEIEGVLDKTGDDILLKLRITDQYYSFDLEETYKDNKLEKGNFTINTSKLSHHIYKLVPSLSDWAKQIDSNEKMMVKFDIMPTKTHMGFKNIIMNSNSIQGSGEVNLSKNSTDISDINLEFSKIDLPNWFKGKKDEIEDFGIGYISNQTFDFNKHPMKANINIKDVKLNENNDLSDINIDAIIENGELYLRDFSGKSDQNGKFKLDGVVTQNAFRSLFTGNISLKHKNLNDIAEYFAGKEYRTPNAIAFTLSSDIKLSSLDTSLHNLTLQTKDADLSANISVKHIGNFFRTNANIKFSYLDLDKGNFPMIMQALGYGKNLFSDMKKEDYLNKFIPVREIKSFANYEINVDKLMLENQLYQHVNMNLDLAPGKILFKKLSMHKGNDWLDSSMSLDANKITPEISINIKDGSMGADFLNPSGMLEFRKKIVDNFDLSKIDITLDFALRKLYQDKFALNHILFQAKNDKDLLNIKKLNADLFGGNMQSSGSILLNPYSLNFSYAANNLQIPQIANLLPKNMINSGGVLSSSGMWSTRGDKLEEQLYNFYTRSKLIAKDITLQNFSIDNLIEEVGKDSFGIKDLKQAVNNAMFTKETNISDLKTNLEFTKGIANLSSLVFTTKYSAASASAVFDLYKFHLDSSAIFSFYFDKPKHGYDVMDQDPTNITVTGKGSIFSLKKSANTSNIEERIKIRNAAIVNPLIHHRSPSAY